MPRRFSSLVVALLWGSCCVCLVSAALFSEKRPHNVEKSRIPSLSPVLRDLKNFYLSTIEPKRNNLTENDLWALATVFGKTVIQNDQPRPQHKNPSAFQMEGCSYPSPHSALQLMKDIQGSEPIAYLSTPCIATDSFGNLVANYVEGRLCANFTGLHYVSSNKGWDIPGLRWNDHNNISIDAFLRPLPSVVLNPIVKSMSLEQIQHQCACPNLCHLSGNSLTSKYPAAVREMLAPLYESHVPNMQKLYAMDSFRHSFPPHFSVTEQETLPLIPDVAIHYRCGDNIHSAGMGLLRFTTLKNIIPSSAHYIYVMSEDQIRKTKGHEGAFCTRILTSLHEYLAESFSNKTIVTLRGAKIFDDMTRLALAPVVVASLSSFSLFAAISNKNVAYYPTVPPHKNSIFGNKQTYIGPNFTWLPQKHMISSVILMRMDISNAANGVKVEKVLQCLRSEDRIC